MISTPTPKSLAQKMRELAFKNKHVIEIYIESLEEIKECAKNGDLSTQVGNDDTVKELLIADGFTLSKADNDAYIIVRW